jgi:dephospho-CoA kinase
LFVLGLTGSIGMGKTTAANMFKLLGVPVYDADSTVHYLLSKNTAVLKQVSDRFPKSFDGLSIDRQILGAIVFNDPQARKDLETIIHPHVREMSRKFLWNQSRINARLVVLDIPLLYETGSDSRANAVVVVTAPKFLQLRRVLLRPGMNIKKLEGILESQMSDYDKRRRADFIVETGIGKAYTYRALSRLVNLLRIQNS